MTASLTDGGTSVDIDQRKKFKTTRHFFLEKYLVKKNQHALRKGGQLDMLVPITNPLSKVNQDKRKIEYIRTLYEKSTSSSPESKSGHKQARSTQQALGSTFRQNRPILSHPSLGTNIGSVSQVDDLLSNSLVDYQTSNLRILSNQEARRKKSILDSQPA